MENMATITRLFSLYDKNNAVNVPHIALGIELVDEKISGKVRAPNTAYGT